MPSAKILAEKQAAVAELTQKFAETKSMVLVNYRGLTVEQDTELRAALRKAGIEYKVYKNTLVRFTMKANNIDGIETYLEGPNAFAYSNSDLVAPAKVMSEFAKKFDKLEIKAGVLEGKVVDAKAVESLAKLPSKEVLIARVLGGLNSPIAGFANVLNANLSGLVRVLDAIAQKQES